MKWLTTPTRYISHKYGHQVSVPGPRAKLYTASLITKQLIRQRKSLLTLVFPRIHSEPNNSLALIRPLLAVDKYMALHMKDAIFKITFLKYSLNISSPNHSFYKKNNKDLQSLRKSKPIFEFKEPFSFLLPLCLNCVFSYHFIQARQKRNYLLWSSNNTALYVLNCSHLLWFKSITFAHI